MREPECIELTRPGEKLSMTTILLPAREQRGESGVGLAVGAEDDARDDAGLVERRLPAGGIPWTSASGTHDRLHGRIVLSLAVNSGRYGGHRLGARQIGGRARKHDHDRFAAEGRLVGVVVLRRGAVAVYEDVLRGDDVGLARATDGEADEDESGQED